jgi:hypothetical protein
MLFGNIVIRHVVCNIVMNYINILPIDTIVVCGQSMNYMTLFLLQKNLSILLNKQ